MSRNHQKVKLVFTKALLSAVFVFGVIAVLSISINPEHLEDPVADRSPASFQPLDEKPTYKMGIMTLGCETKKYESIGVQQIRLKGSTCKKGSLSPILQSQIKNESMGSEATVFLSSATDFTTDYITLMKGENFFSMKSTYADGSVVEKKFSIFAQD